MLYALAIARGEMAKIPPRFFLFFWRLLSFIGGLYHVLTKPSIFLTDLKTRRSFLSHNKFRVSCSMYNNITQNLDYLNLDKLLLYAVGVIL